MRLLFLTSIEDDLAAKLSLAGAGPARVKKCVGDIGAVLVRRGDAGVAFQRRCCK